VTDFVLYRSDLLAPHIVLLMFRDPCGNLNEIEHKAKLGNPIPIRAGEASLSLGELARRYPRETASGERVAHEKIPIASYRAPQNRKLPNREVPGW
jgi:hypothetical protein